MKKQLMSVLACATLFAPLVATAAPTGQQMPQTLNSQQAQMPTVSSAQLKKFANAFQAKQKVQAQYSRQMAQAGSKGEQAKIQKKAVDAIKAEIQKRMPVNDYMKVAKVINKNPQMRKQFMHLLNASR